jgi:protein TonB
MLQKLKQATPAFWKMALSLPLLAALVFVYSCDSDKAAEPTVKVVVSSEKQDNQSSTGKNEIIESKIPDEILNKYRNKYPDIAIKSILIEKQVNAKPNEGISSITVEVDNVFDVDDKLKIEEEIAQALLANNKLVPPPPPAPDAPLADEIFQVVEEQPAPVGGFDNFLKYISENIQYPQQARQKGIEGKVFVQFVVYNDGSIADVQILKGIGAGCDAEAVRVIANSPKWNPGKQNGKPVNVRMSVPIAFKLD